MINDANCLSPANAPRCKMICGTSCRLLVNNCMSKRLPDAGGWPFPPLRFRFSLEKYELSYLNGLTLIWKYHVKMGYQCSVTERETRSSPNRAGAKHGRENPSK
jgi:hypothetical protein